MVPLPFPSLLPAGGPAQAPGSSGPRQGLLLAWLHRQVDSKGALAVPPPGPAGALSQQQLRWPLLLKHPPSSICFLPSFPFLLFIRFSRDVSDSGGCRSPSVWGRRALAAPRPPLRTGLGSGQRGHHIGGPWCPGSTAAASASRTPGRCGGAPSPPWRLEEMGWCPERQASPGRPSEPQRLLPWFSAARPTRDAGALWQGQGGLDHRGFLGCLGPRDPHPDPPVGRGPSWRPQGHEVTACLGPAGLRAACWDPHRAMGVRGSLQDWVLGRGALGDKQADP